MPQFADNLAFGQIGESAIARWLRRRGSSVLPAYEKEINSGKGPRLFTPDAQLVTPDLFIFPWLEFIEAKHKSVFTWYHRSRKWCTGIDLHHYRDYLKTQQQTKRRVWLLFLHRQSVPDMIDLQGRNDCDYCAANELGTCCPPECPTGLFGNNLNYLCHQIDHSSNKYGRHGMVYWAHETLRLMAPLSDLDDV